MKPIERPADRADERGMALLLALIAIVVIGALVMGAFTTGRGDMQGGRMSSFNRQAFEVAEAGMSDVLAQWDKQYDRMAIGPDTALATVSMSPSLRYSPILTRMSGGHYLLRVRGERLGTAGQVLATRSLSRFVRLFVPELDIQAMVTAQGLVRVRGNTDVVGFDSD